MNIPNYLDSLNKRDFKFLPVKSGLTQQGDMLSLGFSCYAIKIYYIINKWDNLSEKDKKNWSKYINSYQTQSKEFPLNSFVDEEYLKSYLNASYLKKERIY